MGRFDRYLLAQFLRLFGFFALVLVSVYWVNRAVGLFDQLIANGQSAAVFLEFTLLSLPKAIRIVLPVAAFAAVVYVTDRLHSESELVVVQATGYSPLRLARPVVVFGAFSGVFLAILINILVPISTYRLEEKTAEVSRNITARLLTEGQFLHPASGITFYISRVESDGTLQNLLLEDARNEAQSTTYLANSAVIVRAETGAKIIMFDGMAQTLSHEDRNLSTTRFDQLVYDLSPFVRDAGSLRRRIADVPTPAMLADPEGISFEIGSTPEYLRFEVARRMNEALLTMVVPVLGFAVLMLGGFSRFGIRFQIFGAILALVVIETLKNLFVDQARSDLTFWFLPFGAPLIGFVAAWALLKFSGRVKSTPDVAVAT